MNKIVRMSPGIAVLLVIATMGLTGQGMSSARATTLPPIPGGLPTHFGYGLFNGTISDMHAGVPYDYRYQYLAGGVNTGGGWQSWGTRYAANYVTASRQGGYIPGFVYYNILQSAPHYDEYSNLNDASTMNAYYNDFKALLQQMSDGQPAFVAVEPDLDGVMMQNSSNTNDDASLQPTKVGGSGVPELAGMADNFRNFWQALAHLRDLYAPNVVLGQDLSLWGPGADLTIALRNDPNFDWQSHADRTATYHNSFGPGYGLNFFSPLDRDAAYYQIAHGSDRWWHDSSQEPSFDTIAAWLGRIDTSTNKRSLMWQVPNGNQQYRTENNTDGHYQDNRAEYFLNASTGRAHMTEWANYGVIGLMFGAGAGGQSHYFDAKGDGITNPPPINGNNLTSTVADDDGGYIRLNVAAYYSGGTLPLPGGGAGTPTPTFTAVASTPTSTRTATRTATRTSTPAGTATATRTPTTPPSTATRTATATRTPTPIGTATGTATGIAKGTATSTTTATRTATATPTRTPTRVATATPVQPTSTPTQVAGQTSTIYSDSLQNGWQNWSWRSTVDFASTAYVHTGTHSISVHYTSPWAGLQLGSNGFSTTGYTRITFWINGGASSGQQMDIYVADANGNYLTSQPLNNYINGGRVLRNSWRQVTVPLSDLGATNRVITAIVLQDATGNAQPTYYLDDMQFASGN